MWTAMDDPAQAGSRLKHDWPPTPLLGRSGRPRYPRPGPVHRAIDLTDEIVVQSETGTVDTPPGGVLDLTAGAGVRTTAFHDADLGSHLASDDREVGIWAQADPEQ